MRADIKAQLRALATVLVRDQQRLVVAESCTGGMLAAAITDLPGSSDWFEGGFVTYSNALKQAALGVSAAVLDGYGAVSLPVVEAMAEGCLAHSIGTVSVSISGIAGPDGGTPEKPVGTVCFGLAGAGQPVLSIQQQFSGDRQAVREQAVAYAVSVLMERCRFQENISRNL